MLDSRKNLHCETDRDLVTLARKVEQKHKNLRCRTNATGLPCRTHVEDALSYESLML